MHSIDWLSVRRRTVGAAALLMALVIAGVWAGNLYLTASVGEALQADTLYLTLLAFGWLEILASVVILAGWAIGWWTHRPLWAPGVLAVVIGMTLHWGWWLIDRKVDLFGTAGFNDPDPELVRRAAVRMWAMLGCDAVAVLLLLVGAVLLLRGARPDPDRQEDPQPTRAMTDAA